MDNLIVIKEKEILENYITALELDNIEENTGYIKGHSRWDNNDYFISWYNGYLVKLSDPSKYDINAKKWDWNALPFIPEKYKYDVEIKNSRQYQIIQSLIKSGIQQIIFASDPDIKQIYHHLLVKMMVREKKPTYKMLLIDSLTISSIKSGIQKAKPISDFAALYDAAYMQDIVKYTTDFNYSKMLSIKFSQFINDEKKWWKYKTISADRTMMCLLGMIVKREREIADTLVRPYYHVFVNCSNDNYKFSADHHITENSIYYNSPLLYEDMGFLLESDAVSCIEKLNDSRELFVSDIKDEITKKEAPLLYNLPELQYECFKNLHLSPVYTLQVVNLLYNKQLITYPITDTQYMSDSYAKDAEQILNGLLKGAYKKKYIEQIIKFGMFDSISDTKYVDKDLTRFNQAILPTGETDHITDLSDIEKKVYHMIVDRYICIFLPHAEYNTSSVILATSDEKECFKIEEKTLVKSGYIEVMTGDREEYGTKLSDFIKVGNTFNADFSYEKVRPAKQKPYTIASLLLAIESGGEFIPDRTERELIQGKNICSCRDGIDSINKLLECEYVCITEKSNFIVPYEDATIIYDYIHTYVPTFIAPVTAASWHRGIRQIAQGLTTKEKYRLIMEADIKLTYSRLSKIMPNDTKISFYKPFISENTGLSCPYCGSSIVTTRNGYKCKNYKKDDGCSFYIGEICSYPMSQTVLKELLTDGRTRILPFVSPKKGKAFKARLILNVAEQRIEFDYS